MTDIADAFHARALVMRDRGRAAEYSYTLMKYLTSSQVIVRYGALMALSYGAEPDLIPALERYQETEEVHLLYRAAEQLIQLIRERSGSRGKAKRG